MDTLAEVLICASLSGGRKGYIMATTYVWTRVLHKAGAIWLRATDFRI